MLESLSQISFVATLIKGGWVMVPLLTCSVLVVAVVFERFIWGPSRARVIPQELEQDAHRLISLGRFEELSGRCRADKSALARILIVALQNSARTRAEITEAVELIGRREAFLLQKHLGVLGTIAAVSPLLGLLGTVSGMITTFAIIAEHGTGNPGLLANGIAEALVSTAAGLTVAIPALLFYRFFLYRARRLIVEIEVISLHLLDEISHVLDSNVSGSDTAANLSVTSTQSSSRKKTL